MYKGLITYIFSARFPRVSPLHAHYLSWSFKFADQTFLGEEQPASKRPMMEGGKWLLKICIGLYFSILSYRTDVFRYFQIILLLLQFIDMKWLYKFNN